MKKYEIMDKLACLQTLQDLEQDDLVALSIAQTVINEISDDEWDRIIEDHVRVCDECGKFMTEGYCISGGDYYYCSDECLHKHYTQDEYLELYDDGNGDSYYTDWI